jgi:transposase
MSEHEQRSVIKFLWKEGCLAKTIHTRLQAVYGDVAYALPSVYLWIKEFKCGREDIADQPRSGLPPIDNLDANILCVLRHSPFGTVRSIAEELGVSPETVHRRLTGSLELQPRFLK